MTCVFLLLSMSGTFLLHATHWILLLFKSFYVPLRTSTLWRHVLCSPQAISTSWSLAWLQNLVLLAQFFSPFRTLSFWFCPLYLSLISFWWSQAERRTGEGRGQGGLSFLFQLFCRGKKKDPVSILQIYCLGIDFSFKIKKRRVQFITILFIYKSLSWQ